MPEQVEMPARYYSESQLGALASAGLVPWVRRSEHFPAPVAEALSAGRVPAINDVTVPERAPPGASTTSAVAERTEPAVAGASSNTVEPTWIGAPPQPLEALGEWLASCPLEGFARRGERRFDTGPADARLLVVSQAAEGERALLPLEVAEATMLKAMMRAIELAPGDYTTAVVVAPGERAEDVAPTVSQRLSGSCGALLWLSRAPVSSGGDPLDAHRMTVAGLPAFRVAHPALLLADPLAKRQAWQVLKALRGVLAGT